MINISINEIYLNEIKSYQKWYGSNENDFHYNLNTGLLIGFINYINLFKRSNNLLDGVKEKVVKVLVGVTVLKKKIIKNNTKKINFSNNNNHKITKNQANSIISNNNKEMRENFSLEYIIKTFTKKHPPFVEIVIDNKDNFNLLIGNLTTSSNNSTLLAQKGMLHIDEVYIYNKTLSVDLNDEKLDNLENLIKNNKDINYTTTIQSSEKCSDNMNNFIENKTNKNIFLKDEIIEEKIKRLKSYNDEIERMNSRED